MPGPDLSAPAALQQRPAPAPAGAALPSIAELDSLPLLPGPAAGQPAGLRSISEADKSVTLFLNWRLGQSANTIVTESGLVTMSAAAGGLEWIICEAFNAGSECETLSLDYTGFKAGLYLLVPDYSQGRWQVLEELETGTHTLSVLMDQPGYYSPLHRQYFAVLAADGGQLSLNAAMMELEYPAQADSLVTTDVYSVLEPLDCNGRPGIFYRNFLSQLQFALADTASPQIPAEWKHSRLFADDECELFRATMHRGRPVVVYCSSLTGKVWLATADREFPVADGDWQRVEVKDDSFWHTYCALHSDGSKLHLAWSDQDPSDLDSDMAFAYISYARSDTTDPLHGFTGGRIRALGDSTGAEEAQMDLSTFAGRPAVAIPNNMPSTGFNILYMNASAADPLPSDWDTTIIDNGAQPEQFWLENLDGLPLVLADGSLLGIYYAYTSNPGGTSDWNYIQISGDAVGPYFSLCTAGGRACLSYSYEGTGDKRPRFSTYSPGGLPADRGLGQQLGGTIEGFSSAPDTRIFSLGGRPALAYVNLDDSTLHFVRLVND
ncbi:MAG: hypothetical protein R3F46_00415 [bacterium]